jgi:hypothetical protein
MGLSAFPHARTLSAVEFALDAVRRDADLMMVHRDDGVPWEEAAAGAPYPDAQELEGQARARPPGHSLYLAVTPINFWRDDLADRKGATGSEPRRAPWNARTFDEEEVVAAYTAHCERVIALFEPDYFVYGIEVNIVAAKRPDRWPGLVRLLSAVYGRLKTRYPALPVALTFQVDFLRALPEAQAAAIAEVMPFSDLAGASLYSYETHPDPRTLPADFFDRFVGLAWGRRFFVAETGWAAEPVGSPYPVFIPASEETQRRYVEWLLGQGRTPSRLDGQLDHHPRLRRPLGGRARGHGAGAAPAPVEGHRALPRRRHRPPFARAVAGLPPAPARLTLAPDGRPFTHAGA